METLFIPCRFKGDLMPAAAKALKKLSGHGRIGIVATAQHLEQLGRVREFLEKSGKKAFICGQILGCDQSAACAVESKVDAFLYMGSGTFHPFGLCARTKKPVVIANPLTGSAYEVTEDERKKYERKQNSRLKRAAGAATFGIMVSTKKGQHNPALASAIKKRLALKGKNALIFAGEEITPERVLPFPVDAWVNTACPRIAEDHFEKPVLNPDELGVVC
ncbi:MAG: diphthamide synthesis protein [Candidatus Altiarchaeota archaeon]|nr:diphthamide synthesis protein [Candidatus Altiarchaeota archaeon]